MTRHRRPHPRRAVARLVGTAVMLLAACRRAEEDAPAAPAAVQGTVVTVTTEPLAESVDAIGTVAGRPGATASLAAPAPARVTRVLAVVGQRVRIGQTLIMLDQTPFAGAARSAAAALRVAEQNAERTRRLAAEGIVPRRDVEQAAAELARAQADAAQAQRQEELATIRAPLAGVVTRVGATLGAMVDAASPLVEIVDPSALDVTLGVTPPDAARIRPGAAVALHGGQDAGSPLIGTGTVADISSVVDSATRSVSVRVTVRSTQRPLRLGETVFGRVIIRQRTGVVVVPLDALVPDGADFKVFVVDSAGVAHERAVQVGARTERVAEIVEGLQPGERVVTTGAYGMADSVKVVPLPTSDSTSPKGTPDAEREQ